jgi:hypothetical protein
MKKNSKLIIATLGIILGACLVGGTIFYAKQNNTGVSNLNNGAMTRPNMGDSSDNSNSKMTPPDNNGNMQRPDRNSDSSSSSDSTNSDSTTSDANSSSSSSSATGDASSSDMSPRMNRGNDSSNMPSMPTNMTNSSALNNWEILLIGTGCLLISLATVYLIMSKAAVNKIFTTPDQIIIFILINIIATFALSFGTVMLTNKYVITSNTQEINIKNTSDSTTSTSVTA